MAERPTLTTDDIPQWHPRQQAPRIGNSPLNWPYGASMPSAVDRVRFSRFVERALSQARSRGMTDPHIEAATGVRASTFHRWRRGEVAPTVDKVRQFCAGLAIPANEALAAMGVHQERVEPEPVMDPDVLALLRKLEDPRVNAETKAFIRSTLQYLVGLAESNARTRRPRRRKAS